MKRLTRYIGSKATTIGNMKKLKDLRSVIDRLAAYEDTDRMPDEISALDYDVAMLKQSARLANQLTMEINTLKAKNNELNDFEHSQLAILLAENGQLKKMPAKIQNTIADLQKKLKLGDMVSRDLVIEILQGCLSGQKAR